MSSIKKLLMDLNVGNIYGSGEIGLMKKFDPFTCCSGHVLSYKNIDQVIVGVDNINQLSEIVSFKNSEYMRAQCISTSDIELLNPSQWRLTGN